MGTDLATGLVQLARLIQDVFTREADGHDLTATQARLLCVLAEGPRFMSELAAILGVEKAAMTGLIDRVERHGLVQRVSVPADRRACRIDLTPAGEKRARAVHADILGAVDQLVGELPATQRDNLRRAITTITHTARQS